MRRTILIWAMTALGAIALGGMVVVAGQQGWFGGTAHRWLTQANTAMKQSRWPDAQAHLDHLLTTFPDSPLAPSALLKLGEVQEAQQHLVEARAAYQQLLEQFRDSPLASETQTHLGQVNIALLFSSVPTEMDTVYPVQSGDSLGKIAAAHGTTVEFLKKANRLGRDVIRPGQQLKVPKGRFSVVVDKSQNQLLLTQENRFMKTYTVATGKDNSTPVGTFKITDKLINPTWYKTGAVLPPGSPKNILGTRWLGFTLKSYGVHGTTLPETIGKQASDGCVRMLNADVEELYDILPANTPVTITD